MSFKSNMVRYPRERLDALSDGIFSVAMTLLVLDIRLPENFQPANSAELLQALFALWPKILPYLLSFLVLGARWLGAVHARSRAESFSSSYIRWWLFYMLLITCIPFSTIVVGRFASLAPSVWLYGGNTALIAIASWRLLELTPEAANEPTAPGRKASMLLLFISAMLCIVLSFVNSSEALWALALNLGAPLLARWEYAKLDRAHAKTREESRHDVK